MNETKVRRIRRLSREEKQSSRPLPRALVEFFARGGVVRRPRAEHLRAGSAAYKHGWEVRLVVRDWQELERVRRQLERAGFRVANWYTKGNFLVQPVYGQLAVYRFEREAPRAGRRRRATRRRR